MLYSKMWNIQYLTYEPKLFEITSSINKTPGTNSAIPWSIYLLTTLLISYLSFSVISVFFGFITLPIKEAKSLPPYGLALAISKSWRVTS